MEIAEAFIKELINPENAKELFYATGKILENATIDNYQGIDKLQLKVIEATYDSYKVAENRPLFSEYGQVWDTWQNALLSWSAKKPANAEEAYKEVKASFDGMMANLNQ
jgi:arabinogalactan oligomer/maltooligosaccharide transport system substrate-binding protein